MKSETLKPKILKSKKFKFKKFIFGFSLFFVLQSLAYADFKIPKLTGPVVDKGNVISYEHERLAKEIILQLNNSKKAQMVLLTVPSLEGQTIEQASIQIADKWQLGSQEQDNGIILVAAIAERAVRIEVGQGLEGTIPDITANRIIEDIIIPTIRSSNLSSGLIAGVMAIAEEIDPNLFKESKNIAFHPSQKSRSSFGSGWGFVFFVLIFIIIRFLNLITGRRHRGRYRGSHWGTAAAIGVLGGLGSSSRGGFGGFGGGGGGFSGGGASGNW